MERPGSRAPPAVDPKYARESARAAAAPPAVDPRYARESTRVDTSTPERTAVDDDFVMIEPQTPGERLISAISAFTADVITGIASKYIDESRAEAVGVQQQRYMRSRSHCSRCGHAGHDVSSCFAKKNVYGQPIGRK